MKKTENRKYLTFRINPEGISMKEVEKEVRLICKGREVRLGIDDGNSGFMKISVGALLEHMGIYGRSRKGTYLFNSDLQYTYVYYYKAEKENE